MAIGSYAKPCRDSMFVICNYFINKWTFLKSKVSSGKHRPEDMTWMTTQSVQFAGPYLLFEKASKKLPCVTGRHGETCSVLLVSRALVIRGNMLGKNVLVRRK